MRDREDRIKLVQSVLNRIGTFEAQKRQKVYHLLYTPIEEAEAAVKDFLSSKGSLKVEKEKNTLVVEDGAYQISVIDSAISVLEEYNSLPQKRVFPLHFISVSEAIGDITRLLSPRGYVKALSGKMIAVEDNRLVIKKVEEELDKVDIPGAKSD